MCSEWHIDLSTWLLTSERFRPSHVRVTLWCLFCIFWVDWNCGGLKAASFRLNCFHHTQVSWLSPPSSADITSIECLHTLGLTFFLCTCSPHVSCFFRMIPQLISQRLDWSSGVKWEFPVSSCCNNKSSCTGERPPRPRWRIRELTPSCATFPNNTMKAMKHLFGEKMRGFSEGL